MFLSTIKENANIIAGLSINFVSSIAIIQVNKYIYVNYEYPNMALTCLNFVFTFIGLLICEKFGVFKIKKVSILKMLPMAASFCGFVVLTNYSLQYNSVGTYQCLKALTTPTVVVISMLIYNQKYSTKIKLSVVNKFSSLLLKKYFIIIRLNFRFQYY
jgi:solute carrier family 35, member E3